MFALGLAGFALLGWMSAQGWFYRGLGVEPNVAAPNDALALLCSCWWRRYSATSSRRCWHCLSRRHGSQADAYACAQASGNDLAAALLKLHEDNAASADATRSA